MNQTMWASAGRMMMIACAILTIHWGAGAAPGAAGRMTFPKADWEKVAPEAEGMDAAKLNAAVEYLKAHAGRDGVHELLIIRNGRVVWEGDNTTKRHGIWSATKSFTSTCLGLLIDDGKCTLDARAADFVPALGERYGAVTLRHFTTMTSGYRAQGDETTGTYTHGPSLTPFIPGEPLFAPGQAFAYWDSAMNMFACTLTRIAGEPLDELFRRRVADPIGMNPKGWRWGTTAKMDGLRINNGSGNRNMMEINAREIARLGHLFLNQGEWDGKRIISAEWVRQAGSVQVPAALPNAWQKSGIEGSGCYGFNWWVNGRHPDGKPLWPGAPSETFAASGHNNNKLFVIPPWRMVVVRLGLDQNSKKISNETLGEFIRLLGEAIERTI